MHIDTTRNLYHAKAVLGKLREILKQDHKIFVFENVWNDPSPWGWLVLGFLFLLLIFLFVFLFFLSEKVDTSTCILFVFVFFFPLVESGSRKNIFYIRIFICMSSSLLPPQFNAQIFDNFLLYCSSLAILWAGEMWSSQVCLFQSLVP